MLIQNLENLKEFVDFLPNLKEDEVYFFLLLARKKWNDTDIKISSQIVLKRFSAKKEHIIEKIQQLSFGPYFDKGVEIPKSCLGLYMCVNPKSLKKATFKTIKELFNKIENNEIVNPNSISLTAIQDSTSKKYFYDLDIDCSNEELEDTFNNILNCVNSNAVNKVKTKGGFHCLINIEKIEDNFKKNWYQNLSKVKNVTMNSDNMIPMPGCYQGSFCPVFEK